MKCRPGKKWGHHYLITAGEIKKMTFKMKKYAQ